MYIPKAYEQHADDELSGLIRSHPFGTLVVQTPDGVEINHLPFVVHADPGAPVVLQGHVARGNPVWRALAEGAEAVAVFQGPDHYISPGWYPSKAETGGKVVPTWNYAVVHAHGVASAVDDTGWLGRHLEELVDTHEAGRTPRWHVSDAPADFTARMVGAVVGVEFRVRELVGKWKLSQNRSLEDRRSVVAALEADGSAGAAAMAAAMRRTLTD